MIVKQLKAEEALTLIQGFKAKPHYRQACDKPVFVTEFICHENLVIKCWGDLSLDETDCIWRMCWLNK